MLRHGRTNSFRTQLLDRLPGNPLRCGGTARRQICSEQNCNKPAKQFNKYLTHGQSVVIAQSLAASKQPGRGDIAHNMEHPGRYVSTQTAISGLLHEEMGCALDITK